MAFKWDTQIEASSPANIISLKVLLRPMLYFLLLLLIQQFNLPGVHQPSDRYEDV
jgi:hypothetical protein